MSASWERYKGGLATCDELGISLDASRMSFAQDFFARMDAPMKQAFDAMEALEKGALANPDEKRQVGHYWLRAPERAPDKKIREVIEKTVADIRGFAKEVHDARKMKRVLVVGIGGSALGPQLVADALGAAKDPLAASFFDNTDPDGFDRTLAVLPLAETLVVVISKSGGTKETRNGMLEAEAAWRKAGLNFAKHAVAVTGEGSELDQHAVKQGWLRRFPMWDWVGGRTSETSAVGLVPAALQGFDVGALLGGAKAMDEHTRLRDAKKNAASLLALSWHHATAGRGQKDMVILPYKDRLALMSRYLQQLVMESLGKEKDLDGKVVNQGIAVYGNKGSTDQHAYVQQLREGVPNFFVTFIQVLKDRDGASMPLEEDVTSGDYLLGFLLGTRAALFEKGRESLTVTLPDVSPRALGGLIALYERAVGFYGTLVNVNAYHQPGVEAGKKAAGAVIALQRKVLGALRSSKAPVTADALATQIGAGDDAETVFKILEHLAANGDRGVQRAGKSFDARFSLR